ncbi:MAG: 1-phosphofructokinase family hexose kinase, partial [Pseudolabrys sp.]|nr:1-phosphofructokinase family hexose kinase [Pseudolabrys sp.]
MADIITLTPNPAVDLSTATERIVPTMKMRCQSPKRDPGGGGVNVARVVQRFGGTVEAILPVGGFTGQLLRRLIDDEGVPSRLVNVEAETREDFAVSELSTAQQYRFVLPGLPLREAEWRACLDALAVSAPPPKFVVGSGSLPPGVPDDFYAQAASIARRLGARFALDTSGAPLKAALDLGVYLIKPNLREMCELAGAKLNGSSDWVAAARQYITAGKVEVVALSLGHRGAFLVTRDLALHAQPLPIQPVSAVGAGDSFLGAMIYALAKGDNLTDAFRLAAAARAARCFQASQA